MSQYLEYNDPIKIIWRKGDKTDPFPPLSDTQKIINNSILLTEIPDEFNHVIIEGYAEINEGEPKLTQFKVDYRTGIVFFNSSEEGKTVTANYFGRGQIFSPATRVYVHNDNPDVVETLQDIVDDGKLAIDALGGITSAIETAQTLETELDNDIATGNTLHTNLQNDINQGDTLKNELETTTIPNSENAKTNLESTITTADEKNSTLNNTINNADTTKLNLDGSISSADTAKINLDESISTATTTKNSLDESITSANNINETLSNTTTGTIKKASDINTNLNDTISNANATKADLEATTSTAQSTKVDLDTSIANGDLDNYIQITEKGTSNGVASLDETGNIPANQLNYVDDKAIQTEQNANNYTDQQITLVTETGIPKLNIYEYKISADVDDSEFIIPLETFDKATDTVRLYVNTTFKDSDYYTVIDSVFDNDALVENAKIVLNTSLLYPSRVVIEVLKNIPIGEEGSVSGVVLAPNTVDDTKIGEKEIDDTIEPNVSNSGFITVIFNWFANRIRTITGKSSWKDAPTKNMEEINTSLNAHLNDFTQLKEEVTQPDTITTSKQIASIIDLPNAVDGQGKVSMEGRTYTNIVKNGNFADGTSGWGANAGNITVVNNTCIMTANGSSSLPNIANNLGGFATPGKKYYIRAYQRVTNNECFHIRGYIYKSGGTTQYLTPISNPIKDRWYMLSGIVTVPEDFIEGNMYVYLIHVYQDAATANGKVMEVQDVCVVDLTALGDTETDIEKLAQKFSYISGTKSVTNTRIKSVGKNIFDGELELGNILTTDGSLQPLTTRIRSKNKIKVRPSTTYTLSNNSGYTNLVFVYSEKDVLLQYYPVSGNNTFTTYAKAHYMRFRTSDDETDLNTQYQLEEGSSATPYEPYEESLSYITLPEGVDGFHSLPNGVKDEVTEDGKLIQRVENAGSIDPSVWSFNIEYSRFYTDMDTYGDLYSPYAGGSALLFNDDGYFKKTKLFTPSGIYFFAFELTEEYLTSKGYTANTSGARQWATDTNVKLIYQLKEPQTHDLAVTPVTCFKDGTVFIDSADDDEEYVLPETQFTYPVNTAGVIQSNVDGINELGNTMNLKANKKPGDWVAAILQNGWTADPVSPPAFYKDSFGVVHFKGRLIAGTKAVNTTILTLPQDYRPTAPHFFNVLSYTTGNDLTPASILVTMVGEIAIGFAVTKNYIILEGTSFRI